MGEFNSKSIHIIRDFYIVYMLTIPIIFYEEKIYKYKDYFVQSTILAALIFISKFNTLFIDKKYIFYLLNYPS